MAKPASDLVLMARIGAAHGIRGEVRVKSFTDDPLAFADYGPLVTSDGSRSFEVDKARVQKTVVVTRFSQVSNRNQAEELNGLELFVHRDQLPEPDEEEFYYTDLSGLRVQDPDGKDLGEIAAVQDFGAGDLLEVRPARGKTFYVPFTREFVPEVNLDGGYVRADLPADYFEDVEETSGGSED